MASTTPPPSRLARPLPQRDTDRHGDGGVEHTRQRGYHRDRTGAQRRIERPHAERLADAVQAAPEDCAEVNRAAGGEGQRPQHQCLERVRREDHA